MKNLVFAVPLIVPAAFGAYLMFTPMKRLLRDTAWIPMPQPPENTPGYFALKMFWRGIGVVAWSAIAVVVYLLFIG